MGSRLRGERQGHVLHGPGRASAKGFARTLVGTGIRTSDAASFVCGESFNVDGGVLME
jgi:hypothetical protein